MVLREDASGQLRKKAAEGKFDFAIVNLPVDESLLDVIPIEQDKLVLVVPKTLVSCIEYLPEGKMPLIDFKQCKNLPFIVVGKTQEMRILFEKMCSAANIKPKVNVEVVGLATAWSMAREGIGATLLPLQFIESVYKEEDMMFFMPKCRTNIRQPAVVTKHGQYLPEYAQYAIQLLTCK